MANRKFGKSSGSLAVTPKPKARQAVLLPAQETRGVYRYTRIHADIYSVYIDTIKKFKGLAKYEGGLYAECTLKEFQRILNEGKSKK